MSDQSGSVSWKSPSNIAIVKYWGKHGEQLPSNPSVSLTLSQAATTTNIEYTDGAGSIDFRFDGERRPAFAARVGKYLKRLSEKYPELSSLDLRIRTSNSFPHSAGIASSASAMSALALCVGTIISEIRDTGSLDLANVSSDARLGSGSAARSVGGPVMLWGKTEALANSSDQHAVVVPEVHPVFTTYQDTILIVSGDEKPIKSTAGHALMNGHPYAATRFEQAHKNTRALLEILKDGNTQAFAHVAESEAFDLHAMMLTSNPPYLLMKPNTLALIEQVRMFREDTELPVCVTLDAGPNIHLLYPRSIRKPVKHWIEDELLAYCANDFCIYDRVGNGAEKIA